MQRNDNYDRDSYVDAVETVYSFDGVGHHLGEERAQKEDPVLAELLGLPEESPQDYTAVLLEDPETMRESAQSTVSCIADERDTFYTFAEDDRTFFTSLEQDGETHGYARGHLLEDAKGDSIYWFDTVKFPSIITHSRYEEFADLHRLAILAHSSIGEQLDVDNILGTAHYIEAPDLKYSEDQTVRIDQLYPGVGESEVEFAKDTTSQIDSAMENPPSLFPGNVRSMP